MKIHTYAKKGDIDGVARELAGGVAVDSPDFYREYTPLMHAVTNPQAGVEMARFLIDQGADVNAVSGPLHYPVLGLAVTAGDFDKIKLLLEAGADIKYKRPHGYDVLIDVMYDRNMAKDKNLVSIVKLLLDRGADPQGVTDFGETALGVASWKGRFDVVKLLLAAGADPNRLQWTAFMQAIVFGALQDAQALLGQGVDLAARDRFGRTPFLLSLQVGDLQKSKLLLSAGARLDEIGQAGKTAIMYPIMNNRVKTLAWLIEAGVDLEATDNIGYTPLMAAVEQGATECVRLLLEAGARVDRVTETNEKAIALADNIEIVRLLLEAGAELNDISQDMRSVLLGLDQGGELDISKEEYFAGQHRRFGKANPELMKVTFWKAMVRTGRSAWSAKQEIGGNTDNSTEGPVWCFERFGRTMTELPDGRFVEIGGEHEDFYDPDFCIYNDVVVHQGDGTFEIFGYPKEVFPPTDFHSATLVGNYIYLIGCLGYLDERVCGETPVYRLNCAAWKMEKVETTGEKPGWIFGHKADYKAKSLIYVSGGKIFADVDHQKQIVDNTNDYVLDLKTLVWQRVEEGLL